MDLTDSKSVIEDTDATIPAGGRHSRLWSRVALLDKRYAANLLAGLKEAAFEYHESIYGAGTGVDKHFRIC